MDQYKLDMQQTIYCKIHVDVSKQRETCLYEYGELEQR